MAKKHFTDLQCKETVYITPDLLLDPTRTYFGGRIPLDPATELHNPTKAEVYCVSPEDAPAPLEQLSLAPDEAPLLLVDGLQVPWSDYDGVFLNPPYGKVLKTWCEKIYEETLLGAEILALLPAGPRFATRYFQEFIFNPGLDAILFVRGRVKFLRPNGDVTTGQNPYDSMVLGFNVDTDRFVESFKHLGAVVSTRVAQ